MRERENIKKDLQLKKALEWEREFLRKETSDPDMTLNSLVELYMDDMSQD